MPEQLPLRFRARTSASFDNFIATENNAATLHALRHWLQEKNGNIFYLFGANASGRSHLLQAASAAAVNAIYLPLAELQHENPAALLEGFEQAELICLDDIDSVLADAHWCEQLFHLFNRLTSARRQLLVSAAQAATNLVCVLPDLQSRLNWGGSFRLLPLDDEGLQRALQLRARERGIDMSDDVAAYVLARYPRDFAALLQLLDTLDRHSLAEQRRITIPFVRRFIERAE